MLKLISIGLLVVVLAISLLSCAETEQVLSPVMPVEAVEESPVSIPPPTQVENKVGEVDTVYWENKLIDETWLSPGVVEIGNFYAGASAKWELRLHNGNDNEAQFTMKFSQPSETKSGYSLSPDDAQDWVIIADPTPVLAAKETRAIMITVTIPKGTVVTDKRWEFWIIAYDASQKGLVTTQLASRWLVTMR